MRILLLLFLGISTLQILLAQSPEFKASAESPTVAVGTSFEVVFELKNGEGDRFQAPVFTDFKKVAGPSTQTSVTIVNGKYSQSMGWTYILQATKPGDYTIGAAKVMVKGQTLQTQPIKIEVTASKTNPANSPKVNATPGAGGNEDIFVALEISDETAFIGQQIIANYVLYTRVGVESYDILEEPKFQGFFAKDMQRFDTRTREITIKGKQYVARTLKSIALFPQQSGTLSIEPMRFQFGVQSPNASRDPFSAFFGRGLQPVSIESRAANIKVKPLPEPAPENFTGGVGKYEWTVEGDKTNLSTDEALSLTLSIRGNGDGKRFVAPKLKLQPELEVYEPKAKEEETYENGESLVHSKTLEYAILPKSPGEYDIRPELVYFDTDSARYVVKKSPKSLHISVSQGKQGNVSLKNEESGDISGIRTSASWQKKDGFFFFSPIFWVLLLLPMLALFGFYFWKKRKEQQAEIAAKTPEIQAKKQTDLAHESLKNARKALQSGNVSAFYDELSKSLNTFLATKLGIAPSAVTQQLVREKLTEKQASKTLLENTAQLLRQCEMARFAAQTNAAGAETAYQLAETTVRELEKL